MRACILNQTAPVEQRPLALSDIERPLCGDDELLVHVNACGVCRTDLHIVEGELQTHKSPVVPGHQIVGDVLEMGKDVTEFQVGQRVGIAWLHHTCGHCRFCLSARENLCEHADFTGWTVDGGYAQYAIADRRFTYLLPENFGDLQAAPLLCAGIIGYRSLQLTGLDKQSWKGARLGIYGFGAAGHVVIQIARARGAEVYVCTRDRDRHQSLALELGAKWVGDATEGPPLRLDASIIFAPAGELVPAALKALDKGGCLVLGGIHMSPIPSFEYSLIYGERIVRSVANNTREDGLSFLAEAASIPVQTHVQTFSLDEANDALMALKHDAIRGAAVLTVV
jgi:alcohol dehydrogenase, propanol-preferring